MVNFDPTRCFAEDLEVNMDVVVLVVIIITIMLSLLPLLLAIATFKDLPISQLR